MSSATTVGIRMATDADWDLITTLDERGFGYTAEGDREPVRAVFEPERTTLAALEDQTVGLASIYSLSMSVPGGALVPTAGVTWVCVQPTHRRQGVLTAMMRAQLEQVRDRGEEPVLALFASDPGIYGRFGYGLASRALSVSIPTQRGDLAWAVDPEPGLVARLAEPREVRPLLEELARRVAAYRAGGLVRSSQWWDLHLHDDPTMRDGYTALRALLVEDAAGPRAYALYRTKIDWGELTGGGDLLVRELGYVDAPAATALWRTLLGHDLIRTVSVPSLPLDDPLMWLLGDVRSPRPRLSDRLFVRIVDVPGALQARSYATAVDVVLDVSDAFAPWAGGRFRLTAGPEGATCTPTSDAPDIALGAAELGAIYLGDTPLGALADAGRVRELSSGAVAATARSFQGPRAAWCPFFF
ncbi:MAG TPA: GNAT family N-acetyltransferase [Actinomycetes bacterium]|nr:GNAT family N-acetyltransferase [Actinomycetes bacterium]